MIDVARCNNRMWIQIPNNVKFKEGDVCPCPKSCTCFQKSEFCVVQVRQIDGKQGNMTQKYSKEEIKQYWGQEDNSLSFNDNSKDTILNASDLLTKIDPSEHLQNNQLNEEREETIAGLSKPKVFGTPHRVKPKNEDLDNDDSILKPQSKYEYFIISGEVFTDDLTIRSSRLLAQPLKNALWEIFSCWETRSVFKTDNELRDDFVWLLTSISKRSYKKSEIDAILNNSEYSISEKFFYLFYDVIYRYEQPRGFYWCDKPLSRDHLHSVFRDKKDFMVKYCNGHAQGEQFRLFYNKHKAAVLHFLSYDNEEMLFDDMTLFLAKEIGEIVLIDKYKNYTPINLGQISLFINNMHQPSELANMKNMIYFLEKYRVSQFGVVPRTIEFPFERSVRDGLQEDVSMYASLNLTSSASYASEYDCYVTLLHEYVKVFAPDKIKIGGLVFSRNNFSHELEEIVKDLCKSYFGKVADDVFENYKSHAWLAKSIYERNILSEYVLENRSYIDKLMQLISKPTLGQYIALFNDSKIQVNSTEFSIHEYIAEILQEDIYTACGAFREDDVVREFLNYKIRDLTKVNLGELFVKYQQQYETFINA